MHLCYNINIEAFINKVFASLDFLRIYMLKSNSKTYYEKKNRNIIMHNIA